MDDVYLPVAFGTWAWHLTNLTEAPLNPQVGLAWTAWKDRHQLRPGLWINLLYLGCDRKFSGHFLSARLETSNGPWRFRDIHPTCCIPSAHAHARLLVDDSRLGRVRPDVILPP